MFELEQKSQTITMPATWCIMACKIAVWNKHIANVLLKVELKCRKRSMELSCISRRNTCHLHRKCKMIYFSRKNALLIHVWRWFQLVGLFSSAILLQNYYNLHPSNRVDRDGIDCRPMAQMEQLCVGTHLSPSSPIWCRLEVTWIRLPAETHIHTRANNIFPLR